MSLGFEPTMHRGLGPVHESMQRSVIEQLLARPPAEIAGAVPMEAVEEQLLIAQRALDWLVAYRRTLLEQKASQVTAVPAAST